MCQAVLISDILLLQHVSFLSTPPSVQPLVCVVCVILNRAVRFERSDDNKIKRELEEVTFLLKLKAGKKWPI